MWRKEMSSSRRGLHALLWTHLYANAITQFLLIDRSIYGSFCCKTSRDEARDEWRGSRSMAYLYSRWLIDQISWVKTPVSRDELPNRLWAVEAVRIRCRVPIACSWFTCAPTKNSFNCTATHLMNALYLISFWPIGWSQNLFDFALD